MSGIIRKFFSVFLSLTLALSFFISAGAAGAPTVESDSVSFETFGEYLPTHQINNVFAVEKLVCEAILNGESSVDISHLKIDSEHINLHSLSNFSPYMNGEIEINPYFRTGENYTNIVIETSMTPDEAQAYFEEVDKKLAYIKNLLADAKNDFEKMLLLHDYLIYTAEYDYDNYLNDTIPAYSYRSCGVLMYGKGVCQSYSYAYMYILSLEGIECHVTSSDEMGHAWNIVKLDGEYYHVDVTWDDPVRDRVGRVNHKYFLRSDEFFLKSDDENKVTAHYGWEEDSPRCTSDIYDNAYWSDVDSAIVTDGKSSYYIKGSAVCKKDLKTNEETELLNPGTWKVWGGGGRWVGAYSGISLVGGDLYYNTPTEIRKMNLETGVDTAVFTPDTSTGYLYGFTIDGTELKYVISISPNESGTAFTTEIDFDAFDSASIFTDLEVKSWSKEGIDYVVSRGYMNGTGNGTTFDQNGTMTRAMIVSVLHRMAGKPTPSAENPFSDLEAGQNWYHEAVIWAFENMIVTGTSATTFAPTGAVTREQMATFLYRYAKFMDCDVSASADLSAFPDEAKVGSWAKEALAWANAEGLITGAKGSDGVTRLDPQGMATREQVATILMRFCKKYVQE